MSKLTLKDYFDQRQDLAKTLSATVRYLCYSILGTIFVIKKGDLPLPQELYPPIVLVIASLFFDFLQYVIQVAPRVYYCHRYYYVEQKQDSDVIENPSRVYDILGWVCYFMKTLTVTVASYFMVQYLLTLF